ncbi:unnamed protein product [Caenorhabditis auriculariae]|uniref:Uncharacterized protein n=1 Tax=Caenorhabditis auriculariae TaxID=2777116 RepID=A0A8S1H522_9PELO|nr:unnamed protein product [Caenorhabditis auriculariae]
MAELFSGAPIGNYDASYLISLVSSVATSRQKTSSPSDDTLPVESHTDGSCTPDDASSVASASSDGAPPAKRRRKPDGSPYSDSSPSQKSRPKGEKKKLFLAHQVAPKKGRQMVQTKGRIFFHLRQVFRFSRKSELEKVFR